MINNGWFSSYPEEYYKGACIGEGARFVQHIRWPFDEYIQLVVEVNAYGIYTVGRYSQYKVQMVWHTTIWCRIAEI